jgi:hypothetical protein
MPHRIVEVWLLYSSALPAASVRVFDFGARF